MAARKLTSAVPFEFKKIGDSVTGVLERIKEVEFTEKDGRTKVAQGAILTLADGSRALVWLSALLLDVMEGVAAGETVTIKLTGSKPPKPGTEKNRSPTKLYEVEVA